ncbi:MAG: hypothetical protein HYU51_08260 [Candidatus Rokubacteria bacterium]|nr:hypothetical protein [Candidatus Rokubacteria bacterium]
MGAFVDLQRFINDHRTCGTDPVAVDTPEPPTREGYRLRALCTCGAVLDRWVSPADARHDFIFTTLLSSLN